MMSSTITQTRPLTSPTTFITSAVPSSLRRLSTIASSGSSAWHARARFGAADVGRHQRQAVVGLPRQCYSMITGAANRVVHRDVEEP
jgi:hypothetical protein